MRLFISGVFGLLLILGLCSCATTGGAGGPDTKVSEDDAIAVAERLAPEYGYDLFLMDIEAFRDVTPWDRLFPGLEFFDRPRYTDIERKLAGRHYWTVNCLPSVPREGGSFCVFVDAETGEVVHVFTGW